MKKEDGEEQALSAKRKHELEGIDREEGSDLTKKCKVELPVAPDSRCCIVVDQEKEADEIGVVQKDDEGFDVDEHSRSNGQAVIDRKGKGILREPEDKGKGILVEESSDDDDEEDGIELYDGDGDSDLSDDPLAEVDLGNILPSRTRQRVVQPGVYVSNDIGQEEEDDEDEDSALDDSENDSEDSDD